MSEHACDLVAVIGTVRYPCYRHQDGVHWFGANGMNTCAAPFCRLPHGHRELHDIPAGKPEVVKGGADA